MTKDESSTSSPIVSSLENLEISREIHAHGGLSYKVLKEMEALLPADMTHTAETGCGRSTILFSNISARHEVFCIEDRDYAEQSSVKYFEDSTIGKADKVHWHFGPSQITLPVYQHDIQYDCVLLDGPHGYPFPDMEYYFFYPHIKPGGHLIVDDIHIPNIGHMADFIQEDAMWNLVALLDTTAVFQRTAEAITSPTGDLWWTQNYNRRRISEEMEFYLDDKGKKTSFAVRSRENELRERQSDQFKQRFMFLKRFMDRCRNK